MESLNLLFCFALCAILAELSQLALSLPTRVVFGKQGDTASIITFPTDLEETETEIASSKPCADRGSKSRLDQKSGQCFDLFKRGPCGENMIFKPAKLEGSIYGACECQTLDNGESTPLVYHKGSDRCYYLYEQGYCAKNEWLVYSETGILKCMRNPCLNSSIENVVLFQGKCVKLFDTHPLCDNTHPVVGFGPDNDSWEPICTSSLVDYILLPPKVNSTCKPGFIFHGSRCRKVSSS